MKVHNAFIVAAWLVALTFAAGCNGKDPLAELGPTNPTEPDAGMEGPRIVGATVAGDNTYLDLELSEPVVLQPALNRGELIFSQNGGDAIDVSVTSVVAADGTALGGPESTLRLLLLIEGTPTGDETIEMIPRDGVLDVDGNPLADDDSTGPLSLHGIEVYPGPGTESLRSDKFEVEVFVGGSWVDAFTYQHRARGDLDNYFPNAYPSVSWVTVGVPTSARVRITYLGNSVNSFDLTPYDIPIDQDGNSAEFDIAQGQKIFVLANAWFENKLFDTLAIFANPPKPPIPPGARYFGPGVHDVGLDYAVASAENTLYLDGGAWVDGTLNFAGTEQPKLLGPGILSGRSWTFEQLGGVTGMPWEQQLRYHLVHSTDSGSDSWLQTDFQMSGPTLVAAPLNNASLYARAVDINHVHVIAPWHSADCMYLSGSESVSIENTFCFDNDDSFAPEYNALGPIRYENNVILGRTPFIIGYGYHSDSSTYAAANAQNIDIIVPEFVHLGTTGGVWRAAIDGAHGAIIVKDQHYKDVTIHGNTPRLFEIAIEDTSWGAATPAQGNVENITFENIRVLGTQWWPSEIKGKDAQNMIRDLKFINLQIDGVYVTDANYQQYFNIGPFTENIQFIVTE